jgi:branched-chain amino acid transport system ATP-binding protein
MLELRSVVAGYGNTTVLRGVDFSVGDGEVVALLGPNGAGKTTLLRTASGYIKPRAGSVEVDQVNVTGEAPHRFVARGMCHIPEGRGIFPSLSVYENLVVQAGGLNPKEFLTRVTDLFPELSTKMKQSAGSLSGGEQQMLALSRAHMTTPKIIIVDEPSLGLAPVAIDRVYEVLAQLADRGCALVIVEQYVQRALELADRVCILARGAVVHEGKASELAADDVYQHYLDIEA